MKKVHNVKEEKREKSRENYVRTKYPLKRRKQKEEKIKNNNVATKEKEKKKKKSTI